MGGEGRGLSHRRLLRVWRDSAVRLHYRRETESAASDAAVPERWTFGATLHHSAGSGSWEAVLLPVTASAMSFLDRKNSSAESRAAKRRRSRARKPGVSPTPIFKTGFLRK